MKGGCDGDGYQKCLSFLDQRDRAGRLYRRVELDSVGSIIVLRAMSQLHQFVLR
jgi:hypothetical protein